MSADLTSRRFAAVLFDLDGTLIDSSSSVRSSWAQWQREFGIDSAQLSPRHGWPSRAIVEALAADGSIPAARTDEAAARIEQIEIAAAPVDGIVALPGASAALAAVAGRSAIATSCVRALADARIAAAQLVAPTVLVTADRVERGKPAPDCYLLAAAELGVDPRDCLVVEDAPAGIAAARAAGCAVLGLLTTTPEDQLDADGVLTDLSKVVFRATSDGVVLVRR